MKTISSTLLILFIALTGRSQAPSTLNDNVKASAEASAERVVQNSLARVVSWFDTLPQHLRNKQAKKEIDELNKGRCYDTLECRLDSIAQILVKDAREHGVKRIAVWYFNDTVTKLGNKMAEKLSIALSNADDSLEIVDRQHIDAVMKEHQLAADGLIDPETAKALGRFLHADAIITGSIRVWNNVINVNIKMLDVETDVILSGKTISIPMKEEYNIKPAVANAGGQYYSLPPGFYFMPGSSPENEHCVNNNSGVLVIKKYDREGYTGISGWAQLPLSVCAYQVRRGRNFSAIYGFI